MEDVSSSPFDTLFPRELVGTMDELSIPCISCLSNALIVHMIWPHIIDALSEDKPKIVFRSFIG